MNSSKRRYYKSSLLYAASAVLPALLSLIMLPFYSRYLSVDEYAIVVAMGTVGMFFSGVFNMALDRAAQRFYFDSKDGFLKRKVFGTFFMGSSFFSLLFFMIVLLISPLLQLAFPKIDFYPYFFLTAITSLLSTYVIMVHQYYRVSETPMGYFLLVISYALLQAGIAFVLIYFFQWQALGQITALLVSSVLLLPVVLMISWRNFIFQMDWKILLDGLRYSWPFIPTLIVAWVLNWSDQIFIANLLNMRELGLYAMAYKISMIFFMMTMAITMTFSPYFFKKANQADQDGVKEELASTISKLAYLLIFAAIMLGLFTYEIVHVALSDKYYGIEPMIRLLLISHVLSGIMSVSSNLYYLQSKKTILQLFVVFFTAVINLILNYFFIPVWGLYGAIYATIGSMVFLTIVHYTFSKKCYFVAVPWMYFLSCIVIGGVCIEVVAWFNENLMIKTIFVAVVVILVVFKKDVIFLEANTLK